MSMGSFGMVLWRQLTWALPLLLAAMVVACAQNQSVTSDGSPVTVPSSRPSPGGPTTTVEDSTGLLSERVPVLPDLPGDYSVRWPEHLGADAAALDNSGVRVTDTGAALGRVLFYDVNLSVNRTVACASCHLQANSFTDRTPQSLGFDGRLTRRNSMSLANVAFNLGGRFFWDQRAASLQEQALEPFADPIEMNLPLDRVVARVDGAGYYRPLFVSAFGDDAVTIDRVADALAQFMAAMVSSNAPYDQGRARVSSPLEDFPNFEDVENEGKTLFFTEVSSGGGGCSGCHTTELFVAPPTSAGNNGLDIDSADDQGVFEVTGDPNQLGSFKPASLRNVGVTAPYMHDGRFGSLADVVEHYSVGIRPHPNLGPALADDQGQPVRLDLTERQIEALVAFLRTLTDRQFLSDDRFRDPFR